MSEIRNTRTRLGRTVLLGCVLLVVSLAAASGARGGVVASSASCPGQQNPDASEGKQEDAMRCLIRHARSAPAKSNRALERAAGRKVGDVIDCGFSHTACGRSFDTYPKRFGYASGTSGWRLGENLAWGRGEEGTPRAVLKAWLDSPPHRATLLDRSFEHIGIGLRRGRFDGRSNVAVWVLEIGCRGC
jgi:uncharacterized protein YkwD